MTVPTPGNDPNTPPAVFRADSIDPRPFFDPMATVQERAELANEAAEWDRRADQAAAEGNMIGAEVYTTAADELAQPGAVRENRYLEIRRTTAKAAAEKRARWQSTALTIPTPAGCRTWRYGARSITAMPA